jgi:MFS family permease
MGLEGLAGELAGSYIIIMLYQSGIDKDIIGLLFSTYLFTVLISDYPTGGFADTWGRTKIHSIGLFTEGISLILISIIHNTTILFIAFILSGLGIAMMSGSLTAWFVDEVKKTIEDQDHGKRYTERYFSLSYGLNSGLGLMGGIAGSLLSIYKISYPILIGGTLFIILSLSLLYIANENYGRIGSSFGTVIEGGKLTIQNPSIAILIMALSLVGGGFMIFAISWQLLLADVFRLPQWTYGIVFSLMLAAMTIGSFSAKYLTGKLRYPPLLPIILIILGTTLSSIGFSRHIYLTITLFLIVEYALGLFRPVSNLLINELIPSEMRAIILSLYSTTNSISSSIGSYIAGYLAETGKYILVYTISAAMTLAAIPLILKPASKSNTPKKKSISE